MNNDYFNDNQKNVDNYLQIAKDLYQKSKDIYGKRYYENYFLPKNFNCNDVLNEKFFHSRKSCDEKVTLLLNDTLFENFRHMEKVPVNSFYQFVNKDNKVIGQYLANIDKQNNISLFAFTLIQNTNDKDDVTIKLDMFFQGKTWINLCRLDSKTSSKNEGHISFFTDHEICNDKENLEVILGAHLHYNCQNKLILSSSKTDYYPAYRLTNEMLNYDGTNLFESCLTYFAKQSGLENCINIETFVENKSTRQNLFKNPIFLYSNQEDTNALK